MVATLEDLSAILAAEELDRTFLSDLSAAVRRAPDAREVRRLIVRASAPRLGRLVAKELNANARARRLVVASYLTADDPMAEYREVAAYDYMTALANRFPREYATTILGWDEEPGDLLGFLGRKKKRWYKRIKPKKILKVLAVGAAVAGAVALGVVTGGAAVPLIATAVSTGASIAMQQKAVKQAKKEEKKIEAQIAAEEAAAAAAYPPAGEVASTAAAATEAVAAQAAAEGQPVAAGAARALGQAVGYVIPQSMASYAAGQVAGKTPEQLAAEYGVPAEQIKPDRVDEAAKVAAGEEPSKPFPVWVLPAAGGGLLVTLLATGVI